MKTRSGLALVLAATAALAALFAQAQQPAGASKANANANSKAPKAINWPSPALPEGPIAFDTAIARGLSLAIVTKGLMQPFSIAFLPDGAILITERPGRLRIVRNGYSNPCPSPVCPGFRRRAWRD
jgi:glucose/arabinose dehydrogenase